MPEVAADMSSYYNIEFSNMLMHVRECMTYYVYQFGINTYEESHISSRLLDSFFKVSCVFAMVNHITFWGNSFVTFATIDGELKVMPRDKTNPL